MFASFVVTLRPTQNASIGNSSGKSLHGLFFKMLEQQDRALAQRVHAESDFKPLTVSPLRGRFKREDYRSLVTTEQLYWVRYTILSDELFNALSKILLGKFMYRDTVTLDGAEFTVQNVTVDPEWSRGWGQISSAEEIWDHASVAPNVSFRFASPTTFRQRGLSLMFPIPSNVFHTYVEKWNMFTQTPIDDRFIPWVEQNVAVEAHQLQTRMMWYGEYQLHGFMGWVRYTAKYQDAARLKQLNALADFAIFCGTGHKATQGMGQTRRLLNRQPAKNGKEEEG